MKGFFHRLLLPILLAMLLIVILIHLAGTWPIIYFVKSSSMEPVLLPGDMIIVKSMDPEEVGKGHIIVFDAPGQEESPYVHRVIKWVDAGEPMWNLGPPAPYSGFITKGDNNKYFDQASAASIGPVKKEWIKGKPLFILRGPLQPLIDRYGKIRRNKRDPDV